MAPILVVGEALVDCVCEHPVASFAEADAFVAHFGGAGANVAVSVARAGGSVMLGSGAADDEWGRWLRDRLLAEGVDATHFGLGADRQTPVAFATLTAEGEPTFAIYGEGISAALVAFGERADAALGACEALSITSNTLVGPEREVTLRLRERALELGKPVCFDPNLRLHRWPDTESALAAARECLPGALLVKANATEARLLTGEEDPWEAARSLAATGPRLVVVTLGGDGALCAGAQEQQVGGRPARVISAIGAGDAFLGTLLAGLQRMGWDPAGADLPGVLEAAAEAGARATETWGAVG